LLFTLSTDKRGIKNLSPSTQEVLTSSHNPRTKLAQIFDLVASLSAPNECEGLQSSTAQWVIEPLNFYRVLRFMFAQVYLCGYNRPIRHGSFALLQAMNFTTRTAIYLFTFLLLFSFSSDVLAVTYDITINADKSFSPSSLSINTGDTVRWTANSNFNQVSSDNHPSHTLYLDPSCPNASCWDSPLLNTSDTYLFTLYVAGTWSYHNHQDNLKTGTITVADTNTPAEVTGLVLSNPAISSIDLTWISPGDDEGSTGNFGTPTTYDIRYSTALITEGNWAQATQVTGEPTPQVAGSTETMTVSGLSLQTTYYFAIKISDEIPNETALSNVPSLATTVTSPGSKKDFVFPDMITDLAAFAVSTTSVKLIWTAVGDDGILGTAASYNIRHSKDKITKDTWTFATKVTGTPVPKEAGLSESLIISGLDPLALYYFALTAIDEVGNEPAFSNVASATTTIPDTTEPTSISDVTYLLPTITSVALSWTAPGDDGALGTAKSYDIRYATTSLSEANWAHAIKFLSILKPKEPGSKESFTISGFDHETTFYIAIKTSDEAGNESAISNVISFTTPTAPGLEPEVEEPEKIINGDIIRAKGGERVYLIAGGRKLWIPTAEGFISAGFKWTDIKEVESKDIDSYPRLKLARAEGDSKVYYITEGGLRRWVPSIDIFNSYGNKWEDVVVVPKKDLDVFSDVGLIKQDGDPKVYVLEGIIKRWIKSGETFNNLGYDWKKIAPVNKTEFDFYVEGAIVE